MKLLGIDSGTAFTGISIIENNTVLQHWLYESKPIKGLKKCDSDIIRMCTFTEFYADVLNNVDEDTTVIAENFIAYNTMVSYDSLKTMQIIGITLAMSHIKGLKYHLIPASVVHKFAGGGSKSATVKKVNEIFTFDQPYKSKAKCQHVYDSILISAAWQHYGDRL